MHWRRRRRKEGEPDRALRPSSLESDVGDECEAFVAGHYAEYLISRGQDVPAWARLNQVAHADHSELQALVESGRALVESGRAPVDRGCPVDWDGVTAGLAAKLLDVAPGAVGGLRGVQLQTLIPLELALARSDLRPQLTVGQLSSLVMTALSTHPSAQKPT